MARSERPAHGLLYALSLALLSASACSTRPDIRGRSDEAQAWAEQQRREDEEARAHPSKLGKRPHPVATPEPRSETAPAPPPRPPSR